MTAKAIRMIAGSLVVALLASCATTYDSQGRPVQSVTPGGAVAGAAAAGLLGYALSKDRKKKKKHKPKYDRNGYYYDRKGKRQYSREHDQRIRNRREYDRHGYYYDQHGRRRYDERYDQRRYGGGYRTPSRIIGYDRYGNPVYH